MCSCMWGPEVDISDIRNDVGLLFIEPGCLSPGLTNIAGLTSQLVLGTPSPGSEAGITHGHPCPLGIYVDPGNWTLP